MRATVGPSVWVVTQRLDATADVVIEELNRRGVPVMRFDLMILKKTVGRKVMGRGNLRPHWISSTWTFSPAVLVSAR